MACISKEELLAKLATCAEDSDTEMAHIEADEMLVAFINDPDITEAYNAVSKWFA